MEGAVIEQLFQEVPRPRQGDNKLLAQKTLNFLGAAGNTEHFFARNGISTEHARSTSGARLYSVLVRISESGKSFLRLRQSTREWEQEGRARVSTHLCHTANRGRPCTLGGARRLFSHSHFRARLLTGTEAGCA